MKRALNLALLFLPTTLSIEQHKTFGATLWLDEMWHWLQNNDQNIAINVKIINMLAKLVYFNNYSSFVVRLIEI